MADTKIISLSGFKGVTIHLHLKGIVTPFFIVISGLNNKEIYYVRKFDKEKVEINLPVHDTKIKLDVSSGKIEKVILQKLKIYHIPYKFNNELKMYREYPIEKISYQKVTNLPHGSPARFIPGLALIQVDVNRMENMPQPVKFFIQAHELGHYYYGRYIPSNIPKEDRAMVEYYEKVYEEDEKEADRFALYQLINKGYNFSGIQFAIQNTLKDSALNLGRILNVYNEIKTIHKNNNL